MSTADHRVLELLDRQHRDYAAMYRVSVKQRAHISEEDMSALQSAFGEIREIMDRIRLRQKEIPSALSQSGAAADPEVTRRNQTIGHLIRKLQAIRRENENSVRRLMTRTRAELRQFQQGRQAVKGYRSQKVVEPRFYDGKR